MSDEARVDDLHALDAVAAEQNGVLAFRVCEDSDEFEPVLMRILAANPGAQNETALISIEDRSGLSLGRYVVPRARLDQALTQADDVDAAAESPSVVPADWESA
jgi:hypothetical protein